MSRWMLAVVGVFFVVFVLTTVLSGEPLFLIPVVILAVLALGYSALNKAASNRQLERHGGDPQKVAADNEDSLPSTHLVTDDETPAGDTPEAHDEISPHDLPIGHPGRQAAEAQAGGEDGTTGGHAEGGAGGPVTGGEDRTAQRTGVEQGSSRGAK